MSEEGAMPPAGTGHADETIRRVHAELSEEFAAKLAAQKDLLAENASKEAAAATRTWTERWIAREREFTRQLEEKDADFRSKVEELRREFADMLRSYASKAQEAMRDREVRDLGNLDEKLKELHRAREDLASVRAQVEEEVGSRFEEALRRERELESKARQEAEALRRREVSAVNEALRAEREQAAAARSELETAHRREMSALESAVASERRMAEENQDRFRSELTARYDRMLAAVEDRSRKQHEARLRQSLEDVERRQRLEVERAATVEEAREEAYQAAEAHFKELVKDLRERNAKEEAARSKKLEQRVRAHYEEQLKATQQQLELALSLNDEMDEKWLREIGSRNEASLRAMSDFEERCKRQYEQRFETYQKKTEEQLRAFTDQRLKEQEREAEQVAVLQQTIREMQMQTEKWRAEYVAEVERRSEAAMAAMEERYVSQLAEAHRELAELREERGREATQVQKDKGRLATAQQRLHRLEEGVGEEVVESPEAREHVRQLRDSLEQLWAAVQADEEEKLAFFERVARAAPATQGVVRVFEEGHEQLSEKSELLKDVTRREYLKYRIKVMHRTNQDPAAKDVGPVSQESRDAVMAELAQLNRQLLPRLRQWESRFETTFVYHGVSYIQAMEADAKRMPELAVAAAATQYHQEGNRASPKQPRS